MSAISTTLEKLSVGQTTAHNNMAWFPLLDAASPAADYLTLDEALNQGSARVTEVDEGGSVPELMFSNESARRVLLLDGEELVGAKQNRIEHTINNLQVAVENLTASESRIRDTDMALEMANFTKHQILSQAGTAMLAQANAVPQNVLSLLR